MRLLTLLIFLLSAFNLVAETVYKTVDEEGNVIFTDKPSTGSEEIELQELQTIKNPNPPQDVPPTPKLREKPSQLYKSLLVTNPADGSGIRSNAGNITITLSLQPSLREEHKLLILLDGKEVSSGSDMSVSLNNVNRGTHTISAQVVDAGGKQLISTSSSFSLLRFHQ